MLYKFIAIGLSAFLLLAGIRIYVLTVEVGDLKITAEREKKEAAIDKANKLSAQSAAHASVLIGEQRRRLEIQAVNEKLLKRVQEGKDANERLADSVRLAVNELFDRARDKFGAVPGDPSGPIASRADAGTEPLNRDLARELAQAWAWCERGWDRVRSIAIVQGACAP